MKNHLKFAIVLIVSSLFLGVAYDKYWIDVILNPSFFYDAFGFETRVFVWIFFLFCVSAPLLPFFFSLWKNKNLSVLFSERKEKQINTFLLITMSIICLRILVAISSFFFIDIVQVYTIYKALSWASTSLDFLYLIAVLDILILFRKNDNFISLVDENRKIKYFSAGTSLTIGIVSIAILLILKSISEIDFIIILFFHSNFYLYLHIFAFFGLIPFLWLLYKTPAFIEISDKGNGKENVKEEAFVWHFLAGLPLLYLLIAFASLSPLYPRLLQFVIMGVFCLNIFHLAKKRYYIFLSSFVILIILAILFVGNLKQLGIE